jgi:hypothetical protein
MGFYDTMNHSNFSIDEIRVLIREDDVNYFTDPNLLIKIHAPLLDLKLPLNLAVIPLADCMLHEPFIDKRFRGRNLYLAVSKNDELVEFMKCSNITVMQHGYTHTLRYGLVESKLHDVNTFKRRMCAGAKILENVGIKPRFFVPPRDYLSKQLWSAVFDIYDGVSLNTMSLVQTSRNSLRKVWFLDFIPKALAPSLIIPFLVSRIRATNYILVKNKFLILEHKGLYFGSMSYHNLIENFKKFSHRYRYIMIVTHHWYFDDKKINDWHKLLAFLINNNVHFSSLQQVYENIIKYG